MTGEGLHGCRHLEKDVLAKGTLLPFLHCGGSHKDDHQPIISDAYESLSGRAQRGAGGIYL